MNLVICHFYQKRQEQELKQKKRQRRQKSANSRAYCAQITETQTQTQTQTNTNTKTELPFLAPSEILSNVREVAQLCVCMCVSADRKPVNIGTQ